MKSKILYTFSVMALALLLAEVVMARINQEEYKPKRQNDNQIILYHDRNDVELFYLSPEDGAPEEIRAELLYGDGPLEVGRSMVRPGKAATLIKTADGKPFDHFVPGIYPGRILVFDAQTGKLKARKTGMEIRIYESYRDDYDSLPIPEATERKPSLDPFEIRQTYLKMDIDLKNEEIAPGLFGLRAEWRELDCYIYAKINGIDMVIADYKNLPPNSILYGIYLRPGIAELLTEGETIPAAHVDLYYSDTGEFYESIPGEIGHIYRSE